jgi:HlyD family secretion protein
MSPKGQISPGHGYAVALLLGAGYLGLALGASREPYIHGFISAAQAQPLRKLIAKLRGQRLPAGIVKATGRTEATEFDIASKYAGKLSDLSVDEGTVVKKGDVIGRIASPELEAQLRSTQTDLQTAKHALAKAEAGISPGQAAMELAKLELERGQELVKSGSITKQLLEQRKRKYESASETVTAMIAERDRARASIDASAAKIEQIQSTILDLTLVSPRNGVVQNLWAQKGEAIAAGEPIATIIDLTDVYTVIFLPAAYAGKLGVGDEARVILDVLPDYVIPAKVSFVASASQYTPKFFETDDERARLMFRVQLRLDPLEVERYYGKVKFGLDGWGFVRTNAEVRWPDELEVRLPPVPVAETPKPLPAPASATNAHASSAPAGAGQAPSSAPAEQAPMPDAETLASPTAAPVTTQVPKRDAEPPSSLSTQAPAVAVPAPASGVASATASRAEPPQPATQLPAPAPTSEPLGASTPAGATEATTEGETIPEFAPASVDRLIGAWAISAHDCEKLFERRGRVLGYRQPVNQFARAAIFEPQRIRLPTATCQLETVAREGGALKLSAECTGGVSYTSRIVYIKLRSDNELLYSPTGDPALTTNLVKCPM